MLIPPINFATVTSGFYRSGHPVALNRPFLETLGLKTIVYIGERTEDENASYYAWAREQGIRVVCIRMVSVKEPLTVNDPAAVTECLKLLLDKSNYPVLIHSNKGKHRVGVVVGVVRKIAENWGLAAIYDEYERFAKGKADGDLQFIEQFTPVINIDRDLRLFKS